MPADKTAGVHRKQTFFNLGMINERGATLKMTLSKDIAPRTYSYICLVHRAAMIAKIVVVPSTKPVQHPDEQTARGKQQFDQLTAQLAPALAQIMKATPSTGVIGAAPQTLFNTQIAAFGSENAKIKAGQTMVWRMINFHSVTLEAPRTRSARSSKRRTDHPPQRCPTFRACSTKSPLFPIRLRRYSSRTRAAASLLSMCAFRTGTWRCFTIFPSRFPLVRWSRWLGGPERERQRVVDWSRDFGIRLQDLCCLTASTCARSGDPPMRLR